MGHMKTAVVVDDSSTIRRICRSLLEKCEFMVEEFVDGEDAKGNLHPSIDPPDLLIVDLVMRELSGVQLIQHLIDSGLGTLGRQKILIVTANATDEFMKDILFIKARYKRLVDMKVLVKPFLEASFYDRLKRWWPADPFIGARFQLTYESNVDIKHSDTEHTVVELVGEKIRFKRIGCNDAVLSEQIKSLITASSEPIEFYFDRLCDSEGATEYLRKLAQFTFSKGKRYQFYDLPDKAKLKLASFAMIYNMEFK